MKLLTRRVSVALALGISANAIAADLPPVIEISTEYQAPSPAQAPVPSQNQNNAGVSQLLGLVDQLQAEVQSLRGQVEAQNFRIKKMESAQLDRYRDLDRRLSALLQQVSAQAKAPVAPAVSPSAEVATASTAPVSAIQPLEPSTPSVASVEAPAKPEPVPVAEPPKPAISDAQAYRTAFELVRSRQYDEAIVAFEAFIRDYPDSARVGNAFYWMGEIYQVEQKPEAAREKFMVVVGQYPDHPKTPLAAYKLGVIYAELGDAERSKEYLNYVLETHPQSNVVPLVNEFLNK